MGVVHPRHAGRAWHRSTGAGTQPVIDPSHVGAPVLEAPRGQAITMVSGAPCRAASAGTLALRGTRSPFDRSNSATTSPPSAGTEPGTTGAANSKMIGVTAEKPSAPSNASLLGGTRTEPGQQTLVDHPVRGAQTPTGGGGRISDRELVGGERQRTGSCCHRSTGPVGGHPQLARSGDHGNERAGTCQQCGREHERRPHDTSPEVRSPHVQSPSDLLPCPPPCCSSG